MRSIGTGFLRFSEAVKKTQFGLSKYISTFYDVFITTTKGWGVTAQPISIDLDKILFCGLRLL